MKTSPSLFYHESPDITPSEIPPRPSCHSYRVPAHDIPSRLTLSLDDSYGGTILIEDMTRHDLSPDELRSLSLIWAKSGNLFFCPSFASAFYRDFTVDLTPGVYYLFDVEGFISLMAAKELPPGRVF